ncbi:MAG: undecaprenyldiphospho-muramoylpentapeptide beta-N-acetylglucosaminyltransferase [Gammaproteobacteria bacterium]|nr:MAG: undecaprenyldiphospho-muramoylpentapeptide beta-N-acetylglucosaminyltransferase [Gammaproteobacteria bacterium]
MTQATQTPPFSPNGSATQFAGKHVLISAGGTGGHVYPALAVAERLRALGARVSWLGTEAGIEARLVPQAGIELHTIFVQGLRGNGWKRKLQAPLTVMSAVSQARKVFNLIKPDVFLGFGGFASGPGAVAAKLAGVPVVVHEQNAAMGLTNKIVSLWAKRVLLAFPIEGRDGHVVGNPIRASIAALPLPSERIRTHIPYRVLVVGGSLGAKAINEVVPTALAPLLGSIELTHQTGKFTYQDTLAAYEERGLSQHVTVCEYIEDMDGAYANADLVIARAGALTVSEIASVGLPAIFIPLPHAVDNHQYLNAKCLADNSAAKILLQSDLTPDNLRDCVYGLLDGNKLLTMAIQARQLSHAPALPAIIQQLSEVIYANDSHH